MAIYVIVHGGASGGWSFRQVAQQLRTVGHEVYTPTLTGVHERAHLSSQEVGLATHIQDIVGVLECEDLWQVILVGHSSGSMVITGLAERVPERLALLEAISKKPEWDYNQAVPFQGSLRMVAGAVPLFPGS